MSKMDKNVSRILNYIDRFLITISAISERVSISAFASLVGIQIGSTSSAVELKICVITIRIEKFRSRIKKKKNHDKILLLGKSQLNRIEVVISKALTDSNICHDEFNLINNMLKEFCGMKEEIKNSNSKLKFKLYVKHCYVIV